LRLHVVHVHHVVGTGRPPNYRRSLQSYVDCFASSMSILADIENFRLANLYPLLVAHRIPIEPERSLLIDLKDSLVLHLCTHRCLK
jgi:hypothetical protein